MSGRGDVRSARGRGGDSEHFFAGSITVGAGERSRSRRREPGAETGGRRDVKNGRQMSRCGDVRSARGRGGDRSTFSRGVSRWERGSSRGAGGGSPGAETGGRRDVKNGRWMSRCGDMRSARGRGCGGVQGNESSWQMSGRRDMRSARGRGGDLEHFFAGSIAVGAGEQSRSRRREPGRGDGRATGCEKRAVDEQVRGYAECARTQGDRSTFRGEYGCGGEGDTATGRGDMRRGAAAARNGNFRGRERVRF